MQYEHATADFHAALKLKQNDPRILKSLAVAYSQSGDYKKAVETARVLAAVNPHNPDDLFYLASLLQGEGEEQAAEKIYKRVLTLQDNHILTLNNLASILADRGEYKKAHGLAVKAVALAPGNWRLLDTRGWIEFKLGRYDNAVKTLSGAADMAPESAIVHYHLGASLHALGKNKAAREAVEKSLKSDAAFKGREEAEELVRSFSE
jgi:tetratricopeptide (TPR) repeat protein